MQISYFRLVVEPTVYHRSGSTELKFQIITGLGEKLGFSVMYDADDNEPLLDHLFDCAKSAFKEHLKRVKEANKPAIEKFAEALNTSLADAARRRDSP